MLTPRPRVRRALHRPTPMRTQQAGLSLVELMVGIAVGMLVVAGAAMLTANQLSDNRRLLLEAQVQQDLRASADVITREVRRSGSRQTPEQFIWTPTTSGLDAGTMDDVSPASGGTTDQVLFRYMRSGVSGGQLGYRLNGSRVQARMTTPVSWVDLTDTKAMTVNSFTVDQRHAEVPTPAAPEPDRLPCPKLCPDGTNACWPLLRVRTFEVAVTATSTSDAAVKRSLRTVTHPRNDQLLPVVAAPNVCPV